MKHLCIKITGRVQGVSFRAWTRKTALELNLMGWVRNEPDGGVYVEVEGEAENVDRFVQLCHQGPVLAKVDSVKCSEGAWHNFTHFEIKR